MLDKFAKKESPILGYAGFGGGASSLLTLASGEITYVDEVFSTYLHKGENSSSTINNGIDLSGEGGLVWVKSRTTTYNHWAFDTERGATKQITISQNYPEATEAKSVTAFNSNGFDIGGTGGDCGYNCSGHDFVYWTFRKCPGFFDIVTWTTTTNSAEQIPHNLGSVPGMIIVKRTDGESNWLIWHRSLSNPLNDFLRFDSADKQSAVGVWGNNAPNSTHFEYDGGAIGRTFVAYVFAHNDGSFGEDSDEAVIKCDSYTGTQSEDTEINVGFEPQFLLIKNTSSNSTDWVVVDTMRGLPVGSDSEVLKANSSGTPSGYRAAALTPTGFKLGQAVASVNGSGDNYIYMAIRRPHKPPEAGTNVFAIDTRGSTGDGNEPTYRSTFPVDLQINRNVNYNGGDTQIAARLTQGKQMHTNLNGAESTNSGMMFDYMNGVQTDTGTSTDQYAWMFKRAPGFLDIVCYNGNGSNRTINHNLGKVPEMIWVKRRDSSGSWPVYHSAIGPTKYLQVNSPNSPNTYNGTWNNTAPTSTVFSLGADNWVNNSSGTYIAYLFSSVSGVSKVGGYSGTGNNIDVDCGFTSGARFVLIKATHDSSTEWFIWDSVRGIVAGNDPYLSLSSTAAQVTNTDYIDPLSTGFTVTSNAPGAINVSGGNYIFYAVA